MRFHLFNTTVGKAMPCKRHAARLMLPLYSSAASMSVVFQQAIFGEDLNKPSDWLGFFSDDY